MRNLLAFLAAALIVVAGAGWYLDWFKFSTTPDSDGHQRVTIDVNVKKAGNDVIKAGQKIESTIEKDKSEVKTDANNIQLKADGHSVEVKTPKVDFTLPVRTTGN